MAVFDHRFATLEEALKPYHDSPPPPLLPSSSTADYRRRRIFCAVFPTDFSQPTPQATPVVGFPSSSQDHHAFGAPPAPAATAGAFSSSASASSVFPLSQEDTDDLELPDATEADGRHQDDAAATPSAAAAEDQLRFDRAWHVVTARIALPSSAAAEDSFGTLPPASQQQHPEADFQEALRLVLHAGAALPRAAHVENIVVWHTQQVRRHYAQHVLPLLSACLDEPGKDRNSSRTGSGSASALANRHLTMVVNCVRTLEAAFRLYLYGLQLIARGLPAADDDPDGRAPGTGLTSQAVVARFQRDVHTLVSKTASPRLLRSLRVVFTHFSSIFFGLATGVAAHAPPIAPPALPPPPVPPAETDATTRSVRRVMHELLASLHHVGLAGDDFQILFAEIMDERMLAYIQRSFAGRWDSAASSIGALQDWIEDHFARLAHEVLVHIGKGEHEAVSFLDVKKWKDVAVGRLSALRMTELFDIVLHWPRSRGGLEDLRISVTTPPRRAQLVAAFTDAMRTRLLHPACPTLEILQTYIAMIRTFHVLDPSNVLLSAVVGPLQLYLCQRDDAVRIVVDGLLAEPQAASEPTATPTTVADRIARARHTVAASSPASPAASAARGKLTELAVLLSDPAQQRRRHIDEEELDWTDMDWVPDPIDAGTNYRRPKTEDVIGTLIGALGSPEAFTSEFQNIIAERLLSAQVVFAKEVKVLNLLKKRFGESALQNCEVMIRDIQDSNRLDAIIHQMQMQQQHENEHRWQPAPTADDIQYQAKILSRLYWPGLAREPFLLPTPVAALQTRYEAGYEHRKARRKLAWLNQLGQARVELELADRTVAVACKTYEAAVVYAFQDPDAEAAAAAEGQLPPPPVRRSIADLVAMLQMDEDLVVMALVFWQKQGVLRAHASGETYVVVESLAEAADDGGDAKDTEYARDDDNDNNEDDDDDDDNNSSNPAMAPAAAPAAAVEALSRQARADEAQRTVYWQFIVGMLTNSAASMPLAQIAMMLKMLVAGGFSWSDEELLEFLGEKTADGALEVVGGKYRLVKK